MSEWLNLLVRWFHVFAGILWIGQTYFFSWLDARLEEATQADPNGQVWLVHSGGFYLVGKQKVPRLLPQKLHWFRWEAAATWASGMLLFVIVYYLGGLMVDDASPISVEAAIGISLALLCLAWLGYDFLWRSRLAKAPKAAATLCYLALLAVAFGLSRILSGRATYLQIGAMLGTIMAANVWLRILPAQRQLVAAIQEGAAPDASLSKRAKQRSKHNTYMVVPVVLIMISNHFPTATYGNEYNWAMLGLLILVGWGAAKILRG
jgi:uncharacterized membrane protein